MSSDSITDEIRGIRHDLAAQFGNDLVQILAAIRRQEASDGRTYVALSPRTIVRKPDEQFDAAEVRALRVPSEDQPPHPADQ